MGIVVAVSVGGIKVCVAVAEGVTGVKVAGSVDTPDGLKQLTSNKDNKINNMSLPGFIMSNLTEYNIFRFHIQL